MQATCINLETKGRRGGTFLLTGISAYSEDGSRKISWEKHYRYSVAPLTFYKPIVLGQ